MTGLFLGFMGGMIAGGATIIGSLPLFSSLDFIQILLKKIKFDFFLGLMLTAAFLGLLIPAFKDSSSNSIPLIITSMIIGILFVLISKLFFEKIMRNNKNTIFKNNTRPIIFVVAIIIQNIPEGLAAGASMTMNNFTQMISLIGIIALQDLTEGMTTGLSLFSLGLTKKQAFLGVLITGLIEAFFGVIGGYLSTTILGILPLIMAFAGGAMLCVTLSEVLEKIKETEFKFLFNTNFLSGIIFMLALNQIH